MSDGSTPVRTTLDPTQTGNEPNNQQPLSYDESGDQTQLAQIALWPGGNPDQAQTGPSPQPPQAVSPAPAGVPPQFGKSTSRLRAMNPQAPATSWLEGAPVGYVQAVTPPSTGGRRPIALPNPGVPAPFFPDSSGILPQNSAEGQMAAQDFNHISLTVRGSAVRVSHLDSMLRTLAMSRNGVKKIKVERLIFAAQQYLNARNYEALRHMRHAVDAFGPNGEPADAPQRVRSMTYTQAVNSITRDSPPVPAATAPNPLVSPKKGGPIHTPLSFQKSPFYTLETPLASPMFFIRPYTRRRVQQTSRFRLNSNLLLDDNNRVYLVSQQFIPQAQDLRPVYFPFYIDITLDDQEVKANTRGVRGSVGSAKPADLTKYLKAKSNGTRSLTVTIHISDQNQYETVSDKSFAMGVYFAHKTPLSKLVSQLKDDRAHFTVEQTKQQLRKAAADEEGIESTAMRFSLRDAVMRTRINHPVRSQLCDHIDCFDAESYFMLQDKAETWKCPVCNRRITYESLMFDDFFTDILRNTPQNVDAVEISPDGEWSVPPQDDESDSGESGDGDEKPPPSKRARTGPEIEVVDLLSDTDEETPEPVKPVSPRASFHSGQYPSGAPPPPPPSGNVDNSAENQRSEGDQQANEQTSTNGGEQLNNAQQVAEGESGHRDGEQRESNGQSAVLNSEADQNGLMNGAAENGSRGSSETAALHQTDIFSLTESQGSVSHPSSPPPPRPPEPRFQIAQMLQSFRDSNSVLFQKSLPLSPDFGMLWDRQDGDGSKCTNGTPSSVEWRSSQSSPVDRTQTQNLGSPHTSALPQEQQPVFEENRAAMPHEDVIDLTGDD